MATENRMICLLGAMDRLWFHQIILFQEQPSLFLHHEITKTTLPTSEISTNPSSRNSSQVSVVTEQQISPAASVTSTPSLDETPSQESDDHDHDEETAAFEFNRAPSKTSSSSSSSLPLSAHKQSRNVTHSNSSKRLRKSKSCKSLGELELEEVKGFMDLGFTFKKESLNKRMMSLIPGLQRLDSYDDDENVNGDSEDDDEEEEEEKSVMRPYLSEAWLVKRPDSPLLNLRIPRVSTAADMKKHLKCWARTVAWAIQQES